MWPAIVSVGLNYVTVMIATWMDVVVGLFLRVDQTLGVFRSRLNMSGSAHLDAVITNILQRLSNLPSTDLIEIEMNKLANWLGQTKRCATEIRPKPSDAAFSAVLSNFDKC